MSVKGLLEAEKKAVALQRRLAKSFNAQMKELKQEIEKYQYLLEDKDVARAWANQPPDVDRIQRIQQLLDETEQLYLMAGDSEAANIFKKRMKKSFSQKLTNLKANEIEVKARAAAHKAQTQPDILKQLTSIRNEGAASELYNQARASGGLISGVGRGFMKDLVTLETKAAGSKTIGEYMSNLYDTYEAGLKDVFVKGIVRGDSYKQMVANLMRTTDITKGKANLLVRTEANAIFNESVRDTIDANPLVKGYRFRAVLDSHTSKTCQKMDGVYIPKEDVVPGVNFPPLHPNCRSTVTTVLVGEDEKKDTVQRYTKNKSNQWVPVPPGMTYPEFKSTMLNVEETRQQEVATVAQAELSMKDVVNIIHKKLEDDKQEERIFMSSLSWVNNLSESDQDLIREYTKTEYEDYNKILRGYRPPSSEMQKRIERLSAVLNQGGGLEEEVVTRRFIDRQAVEKMLGVGYRDDEGWEENLNANYQGQSFHDEGFLSTTLGDLGDLNLYDEMEAEVRILLPKGTPAKYIRDLSAYPNESEILVDKGVEFEIVDVERYTEDDEDMIIISMRALPRG